MIDAGFIYFLNVVVVTRLAVLMDDNAVSTERTAFLIVAQVLGILVFQNNCGLLILAACVVAINGVFCFTDRHNPHWARAGTLFLYLLAGSIVFSTRVGVSFDDQVMEAAAGFARAVPFGAMKIGPALGIQMLGLLLATTEANVWIRIVLSYCGASPEDGDTSRSGLDKKEYRTGRIIGILERTLIYVLILAEQFTAIGFIMAAKGFTRFKELDRKDFAEYVLVGTLCSTLFAVIIGATVRNMLS